MRKTNFLVLFIILLVLVYCGISTSSEGILKSVNHTGGWHERWTLTFENGTIITVSRQPKSGFRIGARYRIEAPSGLAAGGPRSITEIEER